MPINYLGNTFATSVTAGTSLAGGNPQQQLPTTANFGLRFFIISIASNDVITTATAGWNKIIQTDSGAAFTTALFTAELSAGTPTFTWAAAANGYTYGGFFDSPDLDILVASVSAISSNSGSVSPVVASGVTALVEGGLTMALGAGTATTAFGATPAGWTERWEAAGVNFRHIMATRNATTVGSTGNLSWTKDATPWVAFQVELGVANPPGPTLDAAELEISVPIASPGNSAREVELSALLNTGAGNAVIELEICALLFGSPPVLKRRQTYNN